MSTKHKNPHREGSVYWNMFKFMQQKQVFTRQEMVESKIGSPYDITIVLSPRKTSKRGDPRGNPAAHGHLYYLEPFPKRVVGESKRFRLRWREVPLARRGRTPEVKARKVSQKADAVVEAKRDAVTA